MRVTRSSAGVWLLALSVVSGAMPFAFGLIRAFRTGNDVRYLWIALAGLLGAAAVMTVGRQTPRIWQVVALSARAFVLSTTLAIGAALLLGTTLGPGLLVVAASFGLCFAAGCALFQLGTRSEPDS